MDFIEDFKKITLGMFLEEVTARVKKEKIRAYCDILIAYPHTFDLLPTILSYYSDRKRSHWTVNMTQCAEEDFYLVTFSPKETETKGKPIFFFWKALRDDKYVTILSFSLHSYSEIRKSLDSLVGFVKDLWFAWVGSRFLENLDLFVAEVLGDDTKVFASFQTAIERSKLQGRKMRVFPLPERAFVSLEEIRKSTREEYIKQRKIQTFSNMRYRIVSEQESIYFIFSMTDRARITFERGDFTLFVTLLKPLVNETRRILNILRRRSYATKQESTVLGESMDIKSLDLVESLIFRRSKEAEDWYERILSVFSADIPKQKFMNFTLLSGNPYFLVHIIDVENSSSVYLSATSEELQIVPAEPSPKEGTVAKIIDLLQTKVDPSISI
jgi:hypothetical protein